MLLTNILKYMAILPKNSFGFSEVVNGEHKICGGIIMSPNATEKRWNIHT